MNIIRTEKAPGAIGPYSQGYTVGGLVFTSGQIPVDPPPAQSPRASPHRLTRAAAMWALSSKLPA